MPLVAKHAVTGERIDITLYDDPRAQLNAADVVCPECDHPMILKAGLIKIAHFAHKPGSDCKYGVGESRDHLMCKNHLIQLFRSEITDFFLSEVFPEYWIGKRRTDVAQVFSNGWIVAHEIQLASITVQELEERSLDYRAEGADVFWYLGKSANTPANRKWAQEWQEQALVWEFFDAQNETGCIVKVFGDSPKGSADAPVGGN